MFENHSSNPTRTIYTASTESFCPLAVSLSPSLSALESDSVVTQAFYSVTGMPLTQQGNQQPLMTNQLRRLDPKIWRACAGSSVQIPSVHSRVYYFPQGHLEQALSPPQHLSSLVLSRPCIYCRISEVNFLADPVTDEVFAKLLLIPVANFNSATYQNRGYLEESPEVNEEGDEKVLAFAKILTPSDANNGGGFSVPRFCADAIFPPLNFQDDPPVQTLKVTDVRGIVWEFRHIYRGTPRRHLFTTGWSKFVNHKKLVAGDSVVFMKNLKGEVFVGVRRSVRFHASKGPDYTTWYPRPQVTGITNNLEDETNQEENGNNLGARDAFSRNGRGKLSGKAVADTAELAANDMPFEVVYYPRAGWSDFVVKAELVEAAMNVHWTPGVKVKMAVETEDSSRMTWFQGTVATAALPDVGPWKGSPWRLLQVNWDELGVPQHSKRVSPWQVEYVSPTPPNQTAFPLAKKFRSLNNVGVADAEGDPFFPITGFNNSTMGSLRQSLLNYDNFPAGMQGARHDQFSISNVSSFTRDSTPHLGIANFSRNNAVPHLRTVSTDLNIGSSQSENLSPHSQSSVHSFSTEFVGAQCCNSTKPAAGSFQLFGKIIHTEKPFATDFEGVGYTRDEDPKGYNGTEGEGNRLELSFDLYKITCQDGCPMPKGLHF